MRVLLVGGPRHGESVQVDSYTWRGEIPVPYTTRALACSVPEGSEIPVSSIPYKTGVYRKLHPAMAADRGQHGYGWGYDVIDKCWPHPRTNPNHGVLFWDAG